MVVVVEEETCGMLCANASQFGMDQKGNMYMSICILGKAIVVQWIASLKISLQSGVQFWLMALFFFCFMITIKSKVIHILNYMDSSWTPGVLTLGLVEVKSTLLSGKWTPLTPCGRWIMHVNLAVLPAKKNAPGLQVDSGKSPGLWQSPPGICGAR